MTRGLESATNKLDNIRIVRIVIEHRSAGPLADQPDGPSQGPHVTDVLYQLG